MSVYTEEFAGAAADLTTPWVQWVSAQPFRRNGAGVGAPTNADNDAGALYNNTIGNDQYSQVVPQFTGPGNGTKYLYLFVRATPATSDWKNLAPTYYRFWSDGGSDTLIKRIVAGVVTTIVTDNSFTYAAGDTIKLEVIGTALKVYKNGVVHAGLNVNDALVTTGFPGFGLYGSGPPTVDNWEGGDVGVSQPSVQLTDVPPLPLKSIGVGLLTIAVSLLQTTLYSEVMPFSQSDWPVPPLQQNQGFVTIGATGQAEDALQAFRQIDWPVPQGKPVFLADRSWTFGPVPPSLEQRPLFVNDWSLPLRAPLAPLTHAARGAQLADADVAFGQLYWPVPRGVVIPIDSRTHLETRKTYYTEPTVGTPFGQSDWPVPHGTVTPVQQRTWTEYYAVDDNIPFATLVSDVPRRGSIGPPSWTTTRTLFADADVAFVQLDWPLPQGKPAFLRGRTWTLDLQQSTLPPSSQPPFYLTEWPVPRAVVVPVTARTWGSWRVLALVDQFPVGQSLGGVPQGPSAISTLRTWIGWRDLSLVDQMGFGPTDWPIPLIPGRSIDLRTWTQSLNQSESVVLYPFSQTDWPLPTSLQYPISLRTWTDTRRLMLVDQFPVGRSADPLTAPAHKHVTLRMISEARFGGLVDQTGFGPTEWPTPLPAPRAYNVSMWVTNSFNSMILGNNVSTLDVIGNIVTVIESVGVAKTTIDVIGEFE